MRNFKKLSLICISIVLAFSFLISPFPRTTKKQTSTAADNEIQLIDDNVLRYVTISIADKVLTKDNLKHVDNDNDGRLDTSYIIANNSITIEFKPLEYSYSTNYSSISSNFYTPKPETIELTKEADEDSFPTTFTYKEQEYSYVISSDDKITVKNTKTNSSVTESELISITDDENTRTISIITSYTLTAEAPNTKFKFSANNSNVLLSTTEYVLNFERPIVDFKTDRIIYFVAYGQDMNDQIFINNDLKDELSYENVKLQFTNNNYTKNNPLYFEINHNGFIYTFTLYNETIEGTKLLFVEYYDEQRGENNTSLASKFDEEGFAVTTIPAFNSDGSSNMFTIDFKETGRYEVSVYDSTYLLLKNQPQTIEKEITNENGEKETITETTEPDDNKYNYNFTSTSFYIKTTDEEGENSAFKNAYVIMQSYDDDGNVLDYIVSKATHEIKNSSVKNNDTEITPTLNNNVQIKVKNLLYYFENDEIIKNFQPIETMQELNIVEFKKTVFAGSTNIPQSTFYSKEKLLELLKNDSDLTINCSDDAFYEIIINKYDESYNISEQNIYQFTIVKQPKTFFTHYEVDEKNDPIVESGKKKTKDHEIDTPYTTETMSYKININSSMNFSIFTCDKLFDEFANIDEINALTPPAIELSKTYLNEYSIIYAMQAVSIEEVTIKDESNNDTGALGLQFFGIGDITVTITVNSVTTTYTVKSGETLSFEEYGTYSVAIEDSMGTMTTGVFKHAKPVSTSAIILVVLVGVIALAVVLFIISSRGKVKTR